MESLGIHGTPVCIIVDTDGIMRFKGVPASLKQSDDLDKLDTSKGNLQLRDLDVQIDRVLSK